MPIDEGVFLSIDICVFSISIFSCFFFTWKWNTRKLIKKLFQTLYNIFFYHVSWRWTKHQNKKNIHACSTQRASWIDFLSWIPENIHIPEIIQLSVKFNTNISFFHVSKVFLIFTLFLVCSDESFFSTSLNFLRMLFYFLSVRVNS